MKQYFILAVLAVLFSGCEEKMIVVPDLNVGDRRVLVEELTGVSCTNCPDGARELASLQAAYGKENLVVLSLHSGFYSAPMPSSTIDFRNAKVTEMASFIGQEEGYPAAAINRRLLPNQTSAFVTRTLWSGAIDNDFGVDYGLDVFIVNAYDPITRKLEVEVNIVTEAIRNGEHRLTVVVAEDSIPNAQIDNGMLKTNYMHRHAVREVLSKADGDVLNAPLIPEISQTRKYSLVLPDSWKENQVSVVAYIHRGGTPDKEVLQVADEHL